MQKEMIDNWTLKQKIIYNELCEDLDNMERSYDDLELKLNKKMKKRYRLCAGFIFLSEQLLSSYIGILITFKNINKKQPCKTL